MHRSWSIFHWFSIPPAAALVVPTALKTVEGLGLRLEIIPPHFDVSASWIASSLDDWGFGRRRDIVLTEVNASLPRRAFRMWLPTAPVQPNTAAVVMLKDRQQLVVESNITNGFKSLRAVGIDIYMLGSRRSISGTDPGTNVSGLGAHRNTPSGVDHVTHTFERQRSLPASIMAHSNTLVNIG